MKPKELKYTNNIKMLRQYYGLTLAELAGYIKISPRALTAIENLHSNPAQKNAKKICKFFNMPFNKIFTKIEYEKNA